MVNNTRLLLASQSPRRSELLAQLGYTFLQQAVNINEQVLPNELAKNYVERLAIEKAQAGLQVSPDAIVIGSDTSVVLAQEIMGKPDNQAHAYEMMRKLSGKTHQVLTGVAVANQKQCLHQVVTTHVTFKALSDAEIEAYWHTGEPKDKAGGYGIQGQAAAFVTNMEGSYSGVVGLPLYETNELLNQILGKES